MKRNITLAPGATLLLVCMLTLLFIQGCDTRKDKLSHNMEFVELRGQWDSLRILKNPDKGFYYHYLDFETDYWNVPDSSIENFPGMDHIYLRISWATLQPDKDKINWEVLDTIVNKWVNKGFGVSFRIATYSPYELPYSTPKWVVDEGAKGRMVTIGRKAYWQPDYLDPIFLKYLKKMHKQFAEHYDGEPYVRYIDIGSVGAWGEGHNGGSGDPITYNVLKTHVDLFLEYYKKTPLVAIDDFVRNLTHDAAKEKEMLQYIKDHHIWMRDDSPLVGWYIDSVKNFGIYSPQYFDPLYKSDPVVLETEHYPIIKREGNWVGENGAGQIRDKGHTSAEFLKENIKTLHATYIGIHGHADKWLKDNPSLAPELNNMCGYWYFPLAVELPKKMKISESFPLNIQWLNKGVAPAYNKYNLYVKLKGNNGDEFIQQIKESNNLKWLPDSVICENYQINTISELVPGNYSISVKLVKESTKNPIIVELPLKTWLRDKEGFYQVAEIDVDK